MKNTGHLCPRHGVSRLVLVLLVGLTEAQARAQVESCGAEEAEPVVEIVRRGPFRGLGSDAYAQANYDDLIGTISNANFKRFWDGSCGSYKVPVRIVVPRAASCDAGRLAHAALIELEHPNWLNVPELFPPFSFEGKMHGWNDPVYDPLLDQGFHEAFANLRAPFLFGDPAHGGGGITYVGFQANNRSGQLDYIASLPQNVGLGLHLERPEDYAFLYRDLSRWLRQAKTASNFINGGRASLCAVDDVIGFGYSYTSTRLKTIFMDQLNSTWGRADPIFPRGRVLDGALLAGVLGTLKFPGVKGPSPELGCHFMATAWNGAPCNGATPASEGPVVSVQSESDPQIFNSLIGARPDPSGHRDPWDHYKVYEINSASHVEESYMPAAPFLEYLGFDPSLTRQNPLDRSPVLRASLINLLDNIRDDTPLPPSRYMEAHSTVSAWDFGIVSLDLATGNGFGGISLPQAAAPLGLYRGLDCHGYIFGPYFDLNDSNHYASKLAGGSGDLTSGRANFVIETTPGSPPELTCFWGNIEGLFTPYARVDEDLGTDYCGTLYPTRQAYTDRVTAAADELVADRFLLPEERDGIIAAAEAEADEYPECVPGNGG